MSEYFIKQLSSGVAVPSTDPPRRSIQAMSTSIPISTSGRLKSLDRYLRDRLERRIERARDLQFYTGPFLLDGRASDRPGPRMVYLA